MPYDRPANPYHAENDSLILGTDAIPSPGFSRVSTSPLPSGTAIKLTTDLRQFGICNPKGDITITTRVQGVTVGASSFFQGTAILHVLSNAIRVLEPGVLHKPLGHPSLQVLMSFVRQMVRRGRSLRTWKVIINGLRSNIVPSATHSFSSCARMILLAYSLESPSVERYGGRICHPWERKYVSFSRIFFLGH